MATYYLIRGDQIIATIDAGDVDRIALPLLGGGDDMSLFNEQHAQNLMANLNLTPAEALSALGVADLRDTVQKAVFVSSQQAVQSADLTGLVPYHLVDIDDTYSLWQVDGQQSDLLALHNVLWQATPVETLGLLAVVQTFGSAFYAAAVRTATGMTAQQALQRRDRIAAYLESNGYADTGALRAATNEHQQMAGIVTALGYTMANLWQQMVA